MLVGIDASRIVNAYPTGTEIYSLRLTEALLALESAFRFRLYCRTPPPQDLLGLDAEMRFIPFPRLWTHVRLSWEMFSHPPDVLFVPAHVLPVLHPRVSLVTVHDLGYLEYPRAHPWRQRLYLDLSTRWNARAATHILADSKATKTDLVTRLSTPPARITVAYPGRDESLTRERDLDRIEAVKAHHGITGDYLLYLGTLQPRKNLARIIAAFATVGLGAQGRDITLVLAGKRGWFYDDLFTLVRRSGLEKRVLFPGYVAGRDKAALLSGAVAFVFPSLYEGFGLPVLEAQACGCPVITSTATSLPEVAGDAALLVDPLDTAAIADSMERVVGDPGLREALTERGFINIRRFSWRRCAQTVLSAVEQSVESVV
jgi:glycosyltransferase involved in cell wall biosynthesis